MTTISLRDRGFLTKAKLDATFGKARQDMIRRATAGARHTAPRLQAAAQAHVRGALRGSKAARSMRVKVWAQKRDRFPAVQVYSKIPWLGVHERGRQIRGRMLIQIGRGRGRRKAFLDLVARLQAAGLTFFRKGRDGQVYLFARPPKGTRGLAGARRAERGARLLAGKRGRIGRDEAYPIAVLLNTVSLRKRMAVDKVIDRNLPALVRAMEAA